MQLTIPTSKGSTTVEGKVIALEGFEGFTFVLHRSIEVKSKYTITEATAGLSLCTDWERRTTQAATLEAFKRRLENFNLTPAKLQSLIDIQLKHIQKRAS